MLNSFNPFELEKLRLNLIEFRKHYSYLHLNLFNYNEYFSTVLQFDDINTAEAFLLEFIDEYKLAVSNWNNYC